MSGKLGIREGKFFWSSVEFVKEKNLPSSLKFFIE
jgi:hypothetical protein